MYRVFFALAAWLCLSLTAHAVVLPDFTALVERQGAAVVNISAVTQRPVAARHPLDLDERDPMFDLFRRLMPRPPKAPEPQVEPDDESLGSGFIISADGYILTNAHVVADAEEILVRLADKREYRAEIIGADTRSDVALLRIDATGLPVVRLGDPSRLKVGEWVLAIGSPFGFEQSVTAGIVSAKDRSLPDENFVPFIQTDVAINPGNSGGPLFNLKGEVVGINSQIYSRTGGFMGLSFSIPIDVAMDMQQQLRQHGRVQRGRIGVAIQEVTLDLAASFGLNSANGALVSAIEPGSPAALAGVQRGDVIVRFDGRSVNRSNELPRIVASVRPGSQASMMVYRNGAPREMTITLGEWRDPHAPRPRVAVGVDNGSSRLGLVLKEPDRKSRGELGLVVDRADGVAARAEIVPGDRVLSLIVGGKQTELDSVATFNRLLEGLREGQRVSVLVQRGELASFVSLKVGK